MTNQEIKELIDRYVEEKLTVQEADQVWIEILRDQKLAGVFDY